MKTASFLPSNSRLFVSWCWGMIGWNYKSPLVVLDYGRGPGNGMNATKYLEQVIDKVVVPAFEQETEKPDFSHVFFMQDNAPAHKSVTTKNHLTSCGITTMPHPPNSPDLNPIESIWHILKNKIRHLKDHPNSIPKLTQAVKDAWEGLTPEEVNRVVASMPARQEELRTKKGKHTTR